MADDYSKSGPRSPRASAAARERITADQMRALLLYSDENALVSALKEKYGVSPRHPNFETIMQIWRSARQQS